jgi:predicted amidohydrolase YtcJ
MKQESMDEFFEKGFNSEFGGHRFRISAIKIQSDGSLGARTAFMKQPYLDDPSTVGIPIYKTQGELDELVLTAHKHNMGVIIHAIGNGAVEMGLDSFARARKEFPLLSPRHGIVHCQITELKQIERFKELDIIAYSQPIFIDSDMHIVYERVGKELAETSYNFKTYLDYGIHQAFGTDCPVEPFNPFRNLYCAVTRKDIKGTKTYLPLQAIPMEEAVYLYTVGGAYSSGEENIKGKIKPGFLADFVILNKDLFTIPSDEILKVHVISTYVSGECVYSI